MPLISFFSHENIKKPPEGEHCHEIGYEIGMKFDILHHATHSFIIRIVTEGVRSKEVVFRNFAKFTGKHLCQSLFLLKLQTPLGLQL